MSALAAEALNAPPAADAAFAHLGRLSSSPESGVLLLEAGRPAAWAGQLRTAPLDAPPGTSVSFTAFYTTLSVAAQRGSRRAIASAVLHAEPPADRLATALDEKLGARRLVESFRFAPLPDSGGGAIIAGAGGALLRVDATPLLAETVRFAGAASIRARGTVLLGAMIVMLLALAWSDRRSLGRRGFAIGAALIAIALVPWSSYSNLSRIFDPAYYFSLLGGPLTANSGVLLMSGILLVLGAFAVIRSGGVTLPRIGAVIGAAILALGGVALTGLLASGIAVQPWGATVKLWLSWQVPIFLVLFACWLGAIWMIRMAAARAPAVLLRTAAIVAILAGGVACIAVWRTTTQQRLELATRDVGALQRADGDVALLLSRFATQLAGHDSAGTRDEVLKRYAVSDLASAELQVALSTWNADGDRVSDLNLAPLTYDSVAVAEIVRDAIASREPVLRQILGPTGRQAIMAVPHRAGGVTSAVASPRTRLVAENPFAALLGLAQPDQAEPPYTLTLSDLPQRTGASPDSMRWRRLGDEWHGDQLVATSTGPVRAHVEVDLRSWPTRVVRAALIILVDLAVVGLLWALGAMVEGGFIRWARGRTSRWLRSYRGRLTVALVMFFVTPAIGFAVWSYQRLRGDDREVRELLVRETLNPAAGENPLAPRIGHDAGETPLFLYSNALLRSSSDSLYTLLAPAGRALPPEVHLAFAGRGELTANWQQLIGSTRVFWGYRAAGAGGQARYVLAAPARSDEVGLDRRRRDLTMLLLFATAVGGLAALGLSGVAAKALARDLELSRIEVARAERVLAWGEMARQVAHEIKNPLTPIRLGVQHLSRSRTDSRVDFDRVFDENVTRILSEIDRLDRIARAFSRYGSAPSELPLPEHIDVAAILRDVVGLERMGISGVTWTLRGAEDAAFAEARADELRDVLLNVLENARLARARNVVVSLERTERSAAIEIVDDGAGIPTSALPRVFEPHFSTRTTGSGLGLALSRRLLESWGGTIDLTSEEGRGARVVITLRGNPS